MFKPLSIEWVVSPKYSPNIDRYQVSSKLISHGGKCVNRIYEGKGGWFVR
jgi:hypothetical protein